MHRLAAEADLVAHRAERFTQEHRWLEVLAMLAEDDDAGLGFGEVDEAGVGFEIACEDADERGFAAAVGAEEADAVAGAQYKVDIFEERAGW